MHKSRKQTLIQMEVYLIIDSTITKPIDFFLQKRQFYSLMLVFFTLLYSVNMLPWACVNQ